MLFAQLYKKKLRKGNPEASEIGYIQGWGETG